MKETVWCDTRRCQEYRTVSQSVDNGLYAITQLKSFQEYDKLDVQINTTQIQEDIADCIEMLEDLHQVKETPQNASIVERNIVRNTNLNLEDIENAIYHLRISRIELKPPHNSVEQTLRLIEEYAKKQGDEY